MIMKRIDGHRAYTSGLFATMFAVAALLLLASQATTAQGLEMPPEVQKEASMTGQLVDSRKGYVLRVPDAAVLDSSRSGWSPSGKYERRVYQIPGAGEIHCIVTVTEQTIPDSAITSPPYTYTLADSATDAGTAYIKTLYLPTRSVRIELIPHSVSMAPYMEAREQIFKSFRWKPGANTSAIDVDGRASAPVKAPKTNPSIFGSQ